MYIYIYIYIYIIYIIYHTELVKNIISNKQIHKKHLFSGYDKILTIVI